ncbi:MAG: hypothetical protein PHZ09_00410 [Eubacteriales bacterium]|jgi:hypothetical protein|nr:hypothetical protein [Eubacteriales bacterium]
MIAIRIVPRLSCFEEALDRLIEIKGASDEIWLSIYGYFPLEQHREQCERMVPAVQKLKQAGKRVIVELGTTLGHGSVLPDVPMVNTFEKMRGVNGVQAAAGFCPRGKNLIEYQKEVMRIYAALRPWGFYLDDDLRIEYHGPVGMGCLCDVCAGLFNDTHNTGYTPDQLGELIISDTDIREKYIAHNREGMAYYASQLASAAMEVCPDIRMGWEYVLLGQSNGPDFDNVFDALYETTGKPPLSRPGCFFYQDHEPRKMLDKVINTSLQNVLAPDYIQVRRPEIENCSQTAMGKSINGTCVESTLNLAYGCSGLSYSMISSDTEPLDTRIRMWHAFENHRDYWRKLIDDIGACGGTGVAGVEPVFSRNGYKAKIPGDSRQLIKWAQFPLSEGRQLAQIGLPISYERDFCGVRLLHPDAVDYLSDGEIKELLSAAVITDGRTVEKLAARGFGGALPLAVRQSEPFSEGYTDHPANGASIGLRGITDGFTQGRYFHTLITEPACGILAVSGPHTTAALAPTSEGGRWAVVGSALWCTVINGAKCRQICAIADYLGGLPCLLNNSEQVMIIPRATKTGMFRAVTLVNISIGETAPIELTIKNPVSENFVLSRPCFGDLPLAFGRDGEDYILSLPELGAWKTATVRAL